MTRKSSLWNWRWIFFSCIFKSEFSFFLLNEWLRERGRNVSAPSCLSWVRVNGFHSLHNGVEYRYRPLFTIIPLNSWINLEMVKFILYYDSWLCVYNDLAVGIRKSPWQQRLLCEIEGGYFSFVFSKENFDFSSWMNDWEGGEGMCELHLFYHGRESTGSAVYITVPNTRIDLHLPLYSWICELILKRLSSYFILTLDYVFLTISRCWFVRAHDNKDFFVKLKVDFFLLYIEKRILIFPLEWMIEREGKECVSSIMSIMGESQRVPQFT